MMKLEPFVYIAVGAALTIVIAFAVGYGCRCTLEKFEDAKAGDADAKAGDAAGNTADDAKKPLTPKEAELFEDIKNNRLDDKDIKKLVAAGILTENMVEKFLNKLEISKANVPKEKTVENFSAEKEYASF